MELIVALDLAIFDGEDDCLFEEVDSYRRAHKVHAVKFPTLPSRTVNDMAVQDRSGRTAD